MRLSYTQGLQLTQATTTASADALNNPPIMHAAHATTHTPLQQTLARSHPAAAAAAAVAAAAVAAAASATAAAAGA